MKLIRELVSRSAHARALRTPALNHEVRNHSVKNQPVVKRPLLLCTRALIDELFRSFGKPDKICHRVRRFLLQQLDADVSLRCFKNGVCSCGTAHAFSLFWAVCSSYTTLFRVTNLAARFLQRSADGTTPIALKQSIQPLTETLSNAFACPDCLRTPFLV